METYLGTIQSFGYNYAPVGWLPCDGRELPINGYEALFTLINTNYGGDGMETFALPDMRGRIPIHQGQGPGLSNYYQGQFAGAENTRLATANMPGHTHVATFTGTGGGGGTPPTIESSIKASSKVGSQHTRDIVGPQALGVPKDLETNTDVLLYAVDNEPAVNLTGLAVECTRGITGGSVANSSVGGAAQFSILQPYLTVNYCICVEGVYPSRP